jgi:hypothetical protein
MRVGIAAPGRQADRRVPPTNQRPGPHARLRDEVDRDAGRADILATVNAALEHSSASLWLRG